MSMGELVIIDKLLKQILPTLGVGGPLLIIIIILILNPEKVEKLSAILWKVIYCLIKRGEKKIVTHDIQGRVNEFSKSLKKEIANFEPIGMQIQWITEKEIPEEFFKKNKLIIRMRHHNNQNKNFIYATMVFIAKVLLIKTKKYLSSSQKESIDLFIGKKLFKKEKPQIIVQFFEDYFSPKVLSNNNIIELVEKYEIVDKVGLFFPVLVQELIFLGEKVFYRLRRGEIIKEVNKFINFLQKYAEREEGERIIPKNFEGAYCRCGIVIIATKFKREIGDIKPFIKYIKTLVDKKLESIYLIGPASENNIDFINQISEQMQNKLKLEKYATKKYEARIKIKGERKKVDNYLICHRSHEIELYYDKEYQEKFVEEVSYI